MNILVLTTQYPTFDNIKKNKSTFFLHQYTRNWQKEGNKVLVIHTMPVYPKVFQNVVNLKKNKIINKLNLYQNDSFFYKESKYNYESVEIFRLPIKKYIPHGAFFNKDIKDCFYKVNNYLKEKDFKYDIILTDFLNPSLIIGKKLYKETNNNVKLYSILHATDFSYLNNNFLRGYFIRNLKAIDGIGFRSEQQYKIFSNKYFTPATNFLITSGLPKKYLEENINPRKKIKKIITVSRLIKRKNIDTIIQALYHLNKNGENIFLEIIGEGPEENNLKSLITKLDLWEYCAFINKLPRDKIIEKMNKSDCFILVSDRETFGMTYVEAMSQGCITIGSKGEGIDSVLIDGFNGFLSTTKDSKELASKITTINNMNKKEILSISYNAHETAKKMTDEKLASNLIEVFEGLIKSKLYS
ncbi:glycosyltransferase [Pisciglobus halotolerans]|uniref:Glycosyltransferase involved in cell wall bisynthesis n=1 Tax=Pisciglobus halotolerans TaxID=745365 RepID=A0A1I3DL51_9LACT|nr:glycosyltransferase [Pisciglobus halotolerans]SFH87309.1 Glycosyltransferase involved in cell wall bisynthesis [Pisciglobus halotolerans]